MSKGPCDLGVAPGMLNRYIEVFEEQSTDDGCGGQTVTWVSKGGLWCSGALKSGKENKKDDRVRASATVVFRCNYADAIGLNLEVSDKIVFADTGEEYNIRVLDDVEFLRIAMDITCERGVTQ